MITEVWPNTNKAGDLLLLAEMLQLLVEVQIGQAVAIVGEEFLFAVQVFFHRLEPLADVGVDARIYKGDPPVVDVAMEQLETLSPAGQNEVIRDAFVVVQEVVLDRVRAVPQAENEVLMPKVGVVLHHVPK